MRYRAFTLCTALAIIVSCATAPKQHAKKTAVPETPLSRIDQAILDYKAIAGKKGWPISPGDAPMKTGDQGERVLVLRKRLSITEDIPKYSKVDLFDSEVESGVKNFQARHGLTPDGVVGKETLKALKVPVWERIK